MRRIPTISHGIWPRVRFGVGGYRAHLGWLNAPARVLQALDSMTIGAPLQSWNPQAIRLTAGAVAAAAMFFFRRR